MNSLSWLIYLAGVAGVFKHVALVASLGSFFAMLGFAPALYDDCSSEESRANCRRYMKYALCAFPVFIAMLILTPSKNTVYAIAASELGEDAMQSQIGKKSLKAIENWLDEQIGDEK